MEWALTALGVASLVLFRIPPCCNAKFTPGKALVYTISSSNPQLLPIQKKMWGTERRKREGGGDKECVGSMGDNMIILMAWLLGV